MLYEQHAYCFVFQYSYIHGEYRDNLIYESDPIVEKKCNQAWPLPYTCFIYLWNNNDGMGDQYNVILFIPERDEKKEIILKRFAFVLCIPQVKMFYKLTMGDIGIS